MLIITILLLFNVTMSYFVITYNCLMFKKIKSVIVKLKAADCWYLRFKLRIARIYFNIEK